MSYPTFSAQSQRKILYQEGRKLEYLKCPGLKIPHHGRKLEMSRVENVTTRKWSRSIRHPVIRSRPTSRIPENLKEFMLSGAFFEVESFETSDLRREAATSRYAVKY